MRLPDGVSILYEIQHQPGDEKTLWRFSSLDHFGTPKGFAASCDCWQKTGIHGTFDLQEGLAGVRLLKSKWPAFRFRLVKRTYFQHTEIINPRITTE